MSITSSFEVPTTTYDNADRIEGAFFSVQVSAASPDGQRAWTVLLADRSGREYRQLGSFNRSAEKPLCALCERPTAHGGVAAVAFTTADGSVELHELDSEGNSIYRTSEQR
ncbi:MAG: hypothetical protein ACRDYF_12450 [Acidimicrobiia bacterium]